MDGEVIIVAVDASKEISDYAFEWTVRNLAKPMDSVTILAVLRCRNNTSKSHKTNRFFSCLWCYGDRQKELNSSDGESSDKRSQRDSVREIKDLIMQMMKQLCLAHKKQIQIQVKIVSDAQLGSVASKARELEANWVILDRVLKKEAEFCQKQLNCNVVVIDHAVPKFLRAVNPMAGKTFSSTITESDTKFVDGLGIPPSVTNMSSLGLESIISEAEHSVSFSSSEKEQSASFLHLNSEYFGPLDYEESEIEEAESFGIVHLPRKLPADVKIKRLSRTKTDTESVSKAAQILSVPARKSADSLGFSPTSETRNKQSYRKSSTSTYTEDKHFERTSSIRKEMSVSLKNPPIPPPLCSICKHSAPIFSKSPKKFTYKEIERATNGFSSNNLLADGGFGFVYKGKLANGQLIAVKQNKTLSARGAEEFCSEVEILSCAQHRNLVMLIGYCIEPEWLLVYEFACNGSLDKHLYGAETNRVMAWHNRKKVAVGAARGLRYLHEDCRVGCIVHRDFRPNNILLTHEYEPMVGDFGLARWQADGQSAVETQVVGDFGYLAPEYTRTGLVTEKTDVYAFGVVLLELLSGLKAPEFSRITGQNFVQEWARPLLENNLINEIIDPRLKNNYDRNEAKYMMYAASLCISNNPEKRPRMSKVLKILEGDISADLALNHSPFSFAKELTNGIKLGNGRFKTIVQEKNVAESSFSSEYRVYLQGSLAEFVKNLNEDREYESEN